MRHIRSRRYDSAALSDRYGIAIRLLTLGCLPKRRASKLTTDGDKIGEILCIREYPARSLPNEQSAKEAESIDN
jgi:hypothetical protein